MNSFYRQCEANLKGPDEVEKLSRYEYAVHS